MDAVVTSCRSGGKILICGNGGLAAESEHFASEMIGKFGFDVHAPCIALTCNSSLITSLANDSGYQNIFAYQIEVLGKPGDVFIGMTTTRSENIVKACEAAMEFDLVTCIICGEKEKFDADFVFNMRGEETAAIQESIVSFLHYLAYNIKRRLQ